MNTKSIFICLTFISLISLIGCKEETKENSSNSSSTEVASDKSQNSGCTIENVDGGAQITCGSTSAFIANGQRGPQGDPGPSGTVGPAGPQGARGPMGAAAGNGVMPRLIDGDGQMIGDYLISMVRPQWDSPRVAVWDAANDAVVNYDNGLLTPQNTTIYYQELNCVGTPATLGSRLGQDGRVPSGHLIYTHGQFYKVTDQKFLIGPHSRKDSSGNCIPVVNELGTGFFWGFAVVPVSSALPTSLKEGYSIKVR